MQLILLNEWNKTLSYLVTERMFYGFLLLLFRNRPLYGICQITCSSGQLILVSGRRTSKGWVLCLRLGRLPLAEPWGSGMTCGLPCPVSLVLQPVLLGEGGAGCLLLLIDSQLFVIFSQNKYSEAIISHWSQPQKYTLLLLFLESFRNVCLVEIISVGTCMSTVKFLRYLFFFVSK